MKLKLLGFNALFNMQIDIQSGEAVIIGIATGTGVCISSLPRPAKPTVGETSNGTDSADLQLKLDTMTDLISRQLGLLDDNKDNSARPLKTTRPNIRKKRPTEVRQYAKSTFLVDVCAVSCCNLLLIT